MRCLILALALAACSQSPLPPSPTVTPTPAPVAVPTAPGPSFSPPLAPIFRFWVDRYPLDSVYMSALDSACKDWEKALGRPLFSWLDGEPVLLMQVEAIERESATPGAFVGGVTFTDAGVMAFSSEVPGPYRKTVALHELGHLLGLHHQPPGSDSIMAPTLTRERGLTSDDARRAREALWTSFK